MRHLFMAHLVSLVCELTWRNTVGYDNNEDNSRNEMADVDTCKDMEAANLLMNILRCKHVIVIYGSPYKREVKGVSPYRFMSEFEVKEGTGTEDLFLRLYQQLSPQLHLVVIANHTTAINLMKTAGEVDLASRRRTEYRHFSHWLVLCSGEWTSDQRHDTLLLEHVAIVNSHHGKAHIQRLMIGTRGREVSPSVSVDTIQGEADIFPNIRRGLNRRTLLVAALEDSPFVIKRDSSGYKGYSVDILDAMAILLNFTYVIVNPPDMRWGQVENGSWDGLIGQLQKRDVDMVIGPITVHEDREKVMDFLNPPIFTKVDDILYRLQSEKGEQWRILLDLFTPLVLLTLAAALLIFPVLMHVCFMHENPQKHNSVEPSIRPNTYSTRVLLFSWGVFSVIMAGCYSANLVAVFSVHKERLPFTNLGELVRQKEYKFGFESGSIREHIFKSSSSEDMQLVWKRVTEWRQTDPTVFSEESKVHVAKVMSEKYAFIGTKFRLQVLLKGDCRLRMLGDARGLQHYGIGVPQNFPLTGELEKILSSISDSGMLGFWWDKWYTDGGQTEDPCISDSTHSLAVDDVISVFYVLCIGLGLAGLVLFSELVRSRWN